jgi:hypothetical protein
MAQHPALGNSTVRANAHRERLNPPLFFNFCGDDACAAAIPKRHHPALTAYPEFGAATRLGLAITKA